jgi:hypothetical protein
MIRLAALFASAGIAVCLFLIAAWKASEAAQLWTVSDVITRFMPILWPASFGLMAIHAGSTTGSMIIIYTILVLVNGVLYGILGLAVSLLMKFQRGTP